jgi:tRNA dimethylallyltransferase
MTSWSGVSVVEEALTIAGRGADDLLAIVGPTATGKTALATALAERIGGEVVSADSVQIYRAFDIGSGKPTAEELARAPHHLVSVLDPLEPIDAARWAERATRAIAGVRARGRVPIVCGGTFLWVKALLFGLAEAPAANAEVRERHRAVAERQGRASLHDRLRAVDSETAARLHPNDLVRVSRALEVFELSGRPMSEWQREHAFARPRHRARLLAIACDAAALTARIRARVRGWLEQGWVDEVKDLSSRGFGEARAMGSVGYAQVRAMLAGELATDDLEPAIVRATRVFARRQRTWLNHVEVAWVRAEDQSSLGT